MAAHYDAIIVGGGHNGLVCAAYLARAGLRPLVLERRSIVGGAAITEDLAPGFRTSTFSYLMSILHPRIQNDLDLKAHGLAVMPCSDMLAPLDDGDYIVMSNNIERTQQSFARFSKKDAEAYPEFDRMLNETAGVFRSLLWETPFDPTGRNLKTFKEVFGFAKRSRKFGKKFFSAFDMLSMSAYDLLSEWFEDERVMATLAYYASIGTMASPKTPGSAYVIMHHIMGENAGAGGWGFIRGGMGMITQSLASSACSHGAEILVNKTVQEITTQGSKVIGVICEDGTHYKSNLVISNASARHLYENLLSQNSDIDDVKREINTYRDRGSSFKMNVACERPPQYTCLDRALADGALGDWSYPTYVHIAPDIEYIERAFDDAKYGSYSNQPFVTAVCPTIVDDTLAPPGKHVVNLFGGFAPYSLKNTTWDAERSTFHDRVLSVVDRFAPGFSDGIIESQLLLPPDIERIVGMPNGHIFHGELTLDQLFFKRPVEHFADYRTPLNGLYVCGASTHPGGGVSGINGYNAAREILRDSKIRSDLHFAKAD